MKKKLKLDIDAALSKALAPPEPAQRKPSPALNALLAEYTPPTEHNTPSSPSSLSTPSREGKATTIPEKQKPLPIAPERDFQRVANSITREAIPAGMFAGKSKQVYDHLYSLTRGAVVPKRSVRIPKDKLMRGAGIGSMVTLDKHLRHLEAVGLISVRIVAGTQGGNEFSVNLPEESVASTPSTPSSPSSPSYPSQKLEGVPPLETTPSREGVTVEGDNTFTSSKTSFKTNTNDDEQVALSDLNSILCEAARKFTGHTLRAGERGAWAEVARILVAELDEAAARAESVSSVPAFLAAHLRRKLAHKSNTRHREGKGRASATEPSALAAASPDLNRRLTPEEIAEQARVIGELLESGYTIKQAEAQFAESFHPDDWALVRESLTAQGESEEGD